MIASAALHDEAHVVDIGIGEARQDGDADQPKRGHRPLPLPRAIMSLRPVTWILMIEGWDRAASASASPKRQCWDIVQLESRKIGRPSLATAS